MSKWAFHSLVAIPRISDDLIAEFPGAQGFSPRNLGYMKRFAASWLREEILQVPLAKLPWFSQIALIEKLETREARLGYAQLAVDNHWMRPQLVREIVSRSIENLGKSTNNFALTMPIADADKAIRAIRDSYDFSLLGFRRLSRHHNQSFIFNRIPLAPLGGLKCRTNVHS